MVEISVPDLVCGDQDVMLCQGTTWDDMGPRSSNDSPNPGDYCAPRTPLRFRYNLYKSVMRIIIGDLLDFYTDGVHIFM